MKKQLLTLIALCTGFIAMSQTCTPDTSYNTPGIYPINGSSTGFYVYMPDAQEGVAYNEIVQIKAPSDTIIDTMGFQIPATIDTIKIIAFSGLPSSLSYQCDNAGCTWVGGDNGCATFTGTPTSADVGLHVIDIVALGTVDLGFLGLLTDTIRFTMELKVLAPAGINEFISSSSVQFSPNPFTDVAALSFQSLSRENYSLRLVDLTGRTVRNYQGRTELGYNEINIDRSGLPNGLYFYSLEIGNEALAGRISITH